GQVLALSVAQTTLLTAWFAAGTLAGFALAGKLLSSHFNAYRLSALGALLGVGAFCCVIFAAPLGSADLFRLGACLIGAGGGLFTLGTLTACMDRTSATGSGLALGAWGAVQATAVGVGLAAGGIIRDGVQWLIAAGYAPTFAGPAFGYSVVYHIDIAFLFFSLIAIGPLVTFKEPTGQKRGTHIGLARLPS
ncbi:MAG: PucC family protein, partial [Pseudomonadota bacterium]